MLWLTQSKSLIKIAKHSSYITFVTDYWNCSKLIKEYILMIFTLLKSTAILPATIICLYSCATSFSAFLNNITCSNMYLLNYFKSVFSHYCLFIIYSGLFVQWYGIMYCISVAVWRDQTLKSNKNIPLPKHTYLLLLHTHPLTQIDQLPYWMVN